MMDSNVTGKLLGSEIHGFHTSQELDVMTIMAEAGSRWLRPNEIHAILCNHKNFTIHVKPVHLPKSGTIILFDRKKLRNFRKDGHNWKKKKDGKTVKEAHEHLKVGNEERIHVYYAHGQDNSTFVRRCYWLLDKSLEHIVLVHYRETQELQGSPVTTVNSNSSSVSDPTAPWLLSEELDSGADNAYSGGVNEFLGPNENLTDRNLELKLHEINTLEWDELLVMNDPSNLNAPKGGKFPSFVRQNQIAQNDTICNETNNPSQEMPSFDNVTEPIAGSNNSPYSFPESFYTETVGYQETSNLQSEYQISGGAGDSLNTLVNDGLQSQDSFGMWMNRIMTDSPSMECAVPEALVSSGLESYSSTVVDHHQTILPEQVFTVTDVSPAWAFSTEETKIVVIGFFHKDYSHLAKSNLFCVCGDVCVPAEIVQVGVYRCLVSPHSPGLVNLFMSFDGHKPITQVLNFEFRTPILHEPLTSLEESDKWDEFRLQMRLAYLLFTTSKYFNILSTKVSPNAQKEAKKFAVKTSNISNSWEHLIKSTHDKKAPFPHAKDVLFEVTLKHRLKEWLLERILLGIKTTEYDDQGQGVIHLSAILGYTWAIYFFSWSGLSLDFRDKFGWTALHWAAYCGREKMVAVLLSAGAKPNLVTDPTSENPVGCTAADLASVKGYDGLSAYLSEKSLVAHFKDMSLAGNICGSLQTGTTDTVNPENLTEDQLYLKDTLAAYRRAAEAAGRIQSAFRERSLQLRTKTVQLFSPEDEARNIIAAMKIQHAFRNYETRKQMAAAARIQHRFRTWKIRKEFLHLRHQTIKIQAAFRGFQVRRQYCKIIWSVGVLEKAILRWRLKRKGFRGLQVAPIETVGDQSQESDTEEDFYRTSRKQAEERVERSVVRVQAMFHSKKAQQDYSRMKLAHSQATLEYEELQNSETDMEK
ncbi:Calmodulin-binding transcription activator [Quillaja saponaria]|uniref:Calmodulin-binding transcription activator n=1 Tax=Quillaja saponaria TaxID=32244 RepID=A0AAD7PGX3_QUISA|nr:Calmodulin-binding transcription activator [Quillaja saponaria]